MARWKATARKGAGGALAALLVAATGLLGLSAWAMAPYRPGLTHAVSTAGMLLRAPFAWRIVLGDSRVAFISGASDGVLLSGHGGATTGDLVRLAGLFCTLSEARLVVALGVNDAKPDEPGAAGAQQALRAMARSCPAERLTFAAVWPVEPHVAAQPGEFDPREVEAINRVIIGISEETGASYIPAPRLTGHTTDGVHLTDKASRAYLRQLSAH